MIKSPSENGFDFKSLVKPIKIGAIINKLRKRGKIHVERWNPTSG